MKDEEIVARLRAVRTLPPIELAQVLGKLIEGELSQGSIVMYFHRAFPAIPLRVLLDAGAWTRVSDGGLSDEGFNDLLRPWLTDAVDVEAD